eukprot:GHVP01036465.1.p1 GENE.GHVP01036465.1~~GHVP01036465.1.p1  ORF type:complete len:104 (-),score=9.00 GHVP01036465.1:55-366(-)
MNAMPHISRGFRYVVGIHHETKRPICLPLAYGHTWRIHDGTCYGQNYFRSRSLSRVCTNCKPEKCELDCRDLKEFGGYDVNGRHNEAFESKESMIKIFTVFFI